MAKRCGPTKPCSYPRANWWKEAMGIDWLNQGGAAPEEGILFGDEVILWGSTTVTFED